MPAQQVFWEPKRGLHYLVFGVLFLCSLLNMSNAEAKPDVQQGIPAVDPAAVGASTIITCISLLLFSVSCAWN